MARKDYDSSEIVSYDDNRTRFAIVDYRDDNPGSITDALRLMARAHLGRVDVDPHEIIAIAHIDAIPCPREDGEPMLASATATLFRTNRGHTLVAVVARTPDDEVMAADGFHPVTPVAITEGTGSTFLHGDIGDYTEATIFHGILAKGCPQIRYTSRDALDSLMLDRLPTRGDRIEDSTTGAAGVILGVADEAALVLFDDAIPGGDPNDAETQAIYSELLSVSGFPLDDVIDRVGWVPVDDITYHERVNNPTDGPGPSDDVADWR